MDLTELPDLPDLALLVSIARLGSIGRAARAHGLSQPHVSRRMARLERRLGVELLERTTAGTSLTPQGRVVVDWAEDLVQQSLDFSDSVRSLNAGDESAITIGVSMTIAEHLVPTWLRALREVAPRARVAVSVSNSADVLQAVAARTVVLGFVESPTVPATLRAQTVARDELIIAVSPSHAWAERAGVALAELADGHLLVREPGSGTRETIDDRVREAGGELRPALEMASNAALRSAALSGLGPAVLSRRAVVDDLSSGVLVSVRVPGLVLRRDFTAVWRPGTRLRPAARALLEVSARTEL